MAANDLDIRVDTRLRTPTFFSSDVILTQRRKALLVGIRYEGEDGELSSAHNDVTDFRDFIMRVYQYRAEDIVVMLDDGVDPYLQPTRDNLLRELDNLVSGAYEGDRLLLHFSGHGYQVKSESEHEEDGMDECILTCDGLNILDKEFRQRLVDPLPVGCTLNAVFDCCHSGTMLDLEHYRCNHLFPWGEGQTVTGQKVRRHALDCPQSPSWMGSLQQRTHPSAEQHVANKGVIDRMLSRERSRKGNPLVRISSRTSSILSGPLSPRTPRAPRTPSKELDPQTWGPQYFWPMRRTFSSPERLKYSCTGDCIESPTEKSTHSFAACADDQTIFEGPKGGFLTRALIDSLEKDPHPTFQELMTMIAHSMEELIKNVRDSLAESDDTSFQQERTTDVNPTPGSPNGTDNDEDNWDRTRIGYQRAQLGSRKKMNLEERFSF